MSDPGSALSDASESSGRLRSCARRGCEVRFSPYRPQHRFCSLGCRKVDWRDRHMEALKDAIVKAVMEGFEERVEAAVEKVLTR